MFVRYLNKDTDQVDYGLMDQASKSINKITGNIFESYELTGEMIVEGNYQLKAPVEPSKVVAVGLNYKDHAEEVNLKLPDKPMIFIKPSTSVIGTNESIVYPEDTQQLEFEAELGIVIKKEASNVQESEAADYILGYTCANDVTARDIQFSDSILTHLTWAKSYDTFCPIGPGIVELDLDEVNKLEISLYVNGERRQHSNTKELIFSIPYLISFLSKIMTLKPGDVIITGTPHGIGEMHRGDEVSVEIERIGKLKNLIK